MPATRQLKPRILLREAQIGKQGSAPCPRATIGLDPRSKRFRAFNGGTLEVCSGHHRNQFDMNLTRLLRLHQRLFRMRSIRRRRTNNRTGRHQYFLRATISRIRFKVHIAYLLFRWQLRRYLNHFIRTFLIMYLDVAFAMGALCRRFLLLFRGREDEVQIGEFWLYGSFYSYLLLFTFEFWLQSYWDGRDVVWLLGDERCRLFILKRKRTHRLVPIPHTHLWRINGQFGHSVIVFLPRFESGCWDRRHTVFVFFFLVDLLPWERLQWCNGPFLSRI